MARYMLGRLDTKPQNVPAMLEEFYRLGRQTPLWKVATTVGLQVKFIHPSPFSFSKVPREFLFFFFFFFSR